MTAGVLSQILWRYAALEREVQNLINACCSGACSLCTSCCCRPDLCEEAFESVFLRSLHGQDRSSILFTERYGWRTENGCSLPLGRPPVCYEFFCDDLLDGQPDDARRYMLRVLGKLLMHVGEGTRGTPPLADIRDEAELNRIDVSRFKERANAARSALEHVRFFIDNGFFDHDAARQFNSILPMPEGL